MASALRDRRLQIGVALLVAAGVVLAVVLASRDDDRPSLERALEYLPADVAAVLVLDTDLDDDQYASFGGTAAPALLGDQLEIQNLPLVDFETAVSAALASAGIDYDSEVRPVLGGDLVVALPSPDRIRDAAEPELIALQVEDVDAAERLLENFDLREAGIYKGARLFAPGYGSGRIEPGEPPAEPSAKDAEVAVDGDVLIAGDVAELKAAIDRAAGRERGGSGPLTVEAFDRGLEGLPEDALLRLYADPGPILELPELRGLRKLRWIAAIEAFGGTLSFDGDELTAELNVVTDPDGLGDEDLPLSPETGDPELVRREGEIASASLDQSQTTAFLLAAARAIFADSRFVRDVAVVERDLGIDFEREVLRQFAGPSASSVTLDGEFAARSTVADPAAMRELLPRLAPRLPELVRDLDSLGRAGLLSLLFFAPDAPVATSATDPDAAVRIPPVEPNELLFEMRGPRGPRELQPVVPLPELIVFGMVGDVFVVASNAARAREIATAPAEPEDGLSGASVLLAPELDAATPVISRVLGFDPGPVEEAEGSAEIDKRSLRARLEIRYGAEEPEPEEPIAPVFGD